MTKTVVVAGLGFGDEGKGSIVDFLARAESAAAVVRYNGGPQAAHHVVLPDGLWHCFSQFGSGSFLPALRTHLARAMLVKPSNLLAERDALEQQGVKEVFNRLTIDPGAHVVTPWHAMVGRMEESARGTGRHGSCGMGVGQAAYDRERLNGAALTMGDLARPAVLRQKLDRHWREKQLRAEEILHTGGSAEVRAIYESTIAEAGPAALERFYLECGRLFAERLTPDEDFAGNNAGGTIILEGAQGMLLDRSFGFLPYVTKTDTSFRSAEPFLLASGRGRGALLKVGVLRAYATRHGAGPFVSYDPALTLSLKEVHNAGNAWQGSFRAGHFDLLAARYALWVCGGADLLALTCLDRLAGRSEVYVCTAYQYRGPQAPDMGRFFVTEKPARGPELLREIRTSAVPSPDRQRRLAELLLQCEPAEVRSFAGWRPVSSVRSLAALPGSARAFLSYIEQELRVPIGIVSFGATAQDKLLTKHY